MRKVLPGFVAFLLTVGVIVAWVVISRPGQGPVAHLPLMEDEDSSLSNSPKVDRGNTTPEMDAERVFLEARDGGQRARYVEWIAEQGWARHDTPVLRKALVADSDSRVQIAALTVSIALAERHKQSTHEVIRIGLQVASVEVVQQALREARKHPSPELVPDLLEVADSSAAHRFLAIDALAFTDDDRARAKVIEVASRADGDKSERIRAIALLAKIKGQSALELLGRLSGDSDEQVRMVALEALAARETQ